MSTAGGRITAGVGANLIGQHAQDRNQEATVYVGNLDPQASLVLRIRQNAVSTRGDPHAYHCAREVTESN